ncbi:MAG: putative rane protein [Verrucomicrobiales bacterium]|nr:putative rane protein [Verrucomicrobiales bacterium]
MTPFDAVRGVHISFGTVALVIAPLAMITVKGGLWHRRWGKIFFCAMAGVSVTAAIMCWLRTGWFLFLIAILSFYLAVTGYRVLQRKKPTDRANALDVAVAAVMSLAGIGMVALGLVSSDQTGRTVKVAFGVIALAIGTIDIIHCFKSSASDRHWMIVHMTRFLGAYVATVTAFGVVNFQFLPPLWRWLGPTIVGTIAISIWRNQYRRKLKLKPYGNIQ